MMKFHVLSVFFYRLPLLYNRIDCHNSFLTKGKNNIPKCMSVCVHLLCITLSFED